MAKKTTTEDIYAQAITYLKDPHTNGNYKKGIASLRKAANLGHMKAQYNLGICLHEARGEYKEALRYFQKSALQGHLLSHYMIGCYYALGFIPPASEEKAIAHFRLAADGGIADAQYNLGVILLADSQKVLEAVQYLKLAAKQNQADAQYNLGVCYFLGIGCPLSHDDAIHYLELAVRQKQPKAANMLEKVMLAPLPS